MPVNQLFLLAPAMLSSLGQVLGCCSTASSTGVQFLFVVSHCNLLAARWNFESPRQVRGIDVHLTLPLTMPMKGAKSFASALMVGAS